MTRLTKRELRRKLERQKQQRAATAPTDVTVEWRGAAPDARPDGLAYNAASATLTYDLWSAQQDCRDALASGEADIVAFLAGYGSGKSILGAGVPRRGCDQLARRERQTDGDDLL